MGHSFFKIFMFYGVKHINANTYTQNVGTNKPFQY